MSKRSLFTTLIVSLLLLSSSSSHAAMIWGITTLSKNVIFDKYESEMAADNVQDALDEVDARLDYFENQQNPTSYNQSYAPAPTHFAQRRTNALFNTNGIKEACTGVKTPDPNCTRAGLQKTKTIGDSLQVATLSANESHMRFDVLYAGGDTDSVGHHIKVYNTGGAQTLGDEGTQVLRGASYDFNTTVFARGTITSDTGDVFNPVRLQSTATFRDMRQCSLESESWLCSHHKSNPFHWLKNSRREHMLSRPMRVVDMAHTTRTHHPTTGNSQKVK